MSTKYKDIINQTFEFPQEEFNVNKGKLSFHHIDLSNLIKRYGAPLKFSYLPKITENIGLAKKWFYDAFKTHNYNADYYYCYCTKSSHFKPVLEEVLKNDTHIETSSEIDIDIVSKLYEGGLIGQSNYIICNGFKKNQYIQKIAGLINQGFKNCIPVLDNFKELSLLQKETAEKFQVGIRIASEEEPKLAFYTSRLGIGYNNILDYYKKEIKENSQVELKMLHFFINTGIKDNSYYWSELSKCLKVYIELKKICPTLDALNIGGGFPIKNSLAFNYDYPDIVNEIIGLIKSTCKAENVEEPNIFTEFGSYTVGESAGAIYEVLYQKQQNDKEKWNIINSSFITTLPDSWAINKRFIMLPINRWEKEYESVLLGGLTCDSDDFYNSEQHINAIYLPKYNKKEPLYLGFFNTGAYQETLGGYGGLQHCLIPQPKHIMIYKDESGNISDYLFKDEQKADDFLKILGYE